MEGATSIPGVEVTMLRILGEDIHEGRWKNDTIIQA